MRYAVISILLLVACHRRSSEDARATWSPAGKRWAEQLAAIMPGMMCKDTMYFRSCFDVTGPECERIALTEMNRCLDQHPEVVPQQVTRETGEAAGTRIGRCAGGALEAVLRARGTFKGTPVCSDVEHWAKAARDTASELLEGRKN